VPYSAHITEEIRQPKAYINEISARNGQIILAVMTLVSSFSYALLASAILIYNPPLRTNYSYFPLPQEGVTGKVVGLHLVIIFCENYYACSIFKFRNLQ